MGRIVVSKVDVSRRQLSAAVRMLFASEDPIAVHTVASAGYRIARDLAKHRRLNPQALLESQIKPELLGEFWRTFNGPANFFKHADSDPDAILDSVEEEVNDFILFLGISCFAALSERQTTEMRAYSAWFMVSHPRFFPTHGAKLEQVAEFVGFADLSRRERLQQGPLVVDVQRRLDADESAA